MKRAFQPLPRSARFRQSYDVAIVGAGVGGLVAANLLAQAGLRVLVAEQHYVVGGYCSSFFRKGFKFDSACHFYPLLGNPDSLTGRLLDSFGCRVRWHRMDPVDRFHLPDGSTWNVPADYDAYRAMLKREFPHQAGALNDFFEAAHSAYRYGLLAYFRKLHSEPFETYRELTLRDALDQHFSDDRLKLLLAADCAHWGSKPSRTSFVFDSMLRISYFIGNYYPLGGSQAFVDDLARTFTEHGGHITLRTKVTEIIVENQCAVGVRVQRGANAHEIEEVRARHVISNADLRKTCGSLIPKSQFSPQLIDRIAGLQKTVPCYLIHMGLADTKETELDPLQGYYWNSWDAETVATGGLTFKLFCPTCYDSNLAPPGSQILIVQRVTETDFDAISDWEAEKNRVQEELLESLRPLFPSCRERAEILMTASALTAARFTGNSSGSMLGWEMSPDQLGEARPSVRSGIDGLSFVGHWAEPGGGITPVIVSAQMASKAILKDFRLARP